MSISIGDRRAEYAKIVGWRCRWGCSGMLKCTGGYKDIPMPDAEPTPDELLRYKAEVGSLARENTEVQRPASVLRAVYVCLVGNLAMEQDDSAGTSRLESSRDVFCDTSRGTPETRRLGPGRGETVDVGRDRVVNPTYCDTAFGVIDNEQLRSGLARHESNDGRPIYELEFLR